MWYIWSQALVAELEADMHAFGHTPRVVTRIRVRVRFVTPHPLYLSNMFLCPRYHINPAVRTVDRKECLWVPPPPVLQTAGSSSVAPPLALTAREEEGLPAAAAAVGSDITEQHVTSVMEMGIREHRDRISRLAVALLVLGIEEYAIVAR